MVCVVVPLMVLPFVLVEKNLLFGAASAHVGARRTREREDARMPHAWSEAQGPGEDGGERTRLDGGMRRREAGRGAD